MTAIQVHEVGTEFFLVQSQEADLHRNIYIKRFVRADRNVNMICDPGTRLDIPALTEVARSLMGGLHNLDIIFLSHQDPDVSSNTPELLAAAPHARVIASIDTWRLVKMYGIPESRFFAAEGFERSFLQIRDSGQRLKFVPARYCHFRGALMVYDLESRVLFSGDFLGGLSTRKGDGFLADETSWPGISLFHQIYMPTERAIRATIDQIAMLHPAPLAIAPQHGDVIAGELVGEFAARLANLEVAVDLEPKPGPERDRVLLCLNSFLDSLRQHDPELHARLLLELESPRGFTTLFVFVSGALTEIKVSPRDALSSFWSSVERISPAGDLNLLRAMFVTAVDQAGLASPRELAEGAGEVAGLLREVEEWEDDGGTHES